MNGWSNSQGAGWMPEDTADFQELAGPGGERKLMGDAGFGDRLR